VFQHDLEKNFPVILGKIPSTVLVVGAWRGDEIHSFLKWNTREIHAFEPNPGNFKYLHDAFLKKRNIIVYQTACSNISGIAQLFEASITGNDSLLEIKEDGRIRSAASYEVETVKLDDVQGLKGREIDLFWIDVQGFEKKVFEGSEDILKNTKAIFAELNGTDAAYRDAVTAEDLTLFLQCKGFYVAHQEFASDKEKEGGVALFLRNNISTDFFDQNKIDARYPSLINTLKKRHLMTLNPVYRLVGKIIPISMKSKIKSLLR